MAKARNTRRNLDKKDEWGNVLVPEQKIRDLLASYRCRLKTKAECVDALVETYNIDRASAMNYYDAYIYKYEQYTMEFQAQLATGVLATLRGMLENLEQMRLQFQSEGDKYAATSTVKIQHDIVKTIAKTFIPQQVNISVQGVDDETLKNRLLEYYGKGERGDKP